MRNFKQSFKSATIVVADSADMEGTRLTFELGKNEQAKAYFPVPEKIADCLNECNQSKGSAQLSERYRSRGKSSR